MEILKKYKYFINEAVDNDKELSNPKDVPGEVYTGVKKIIQGVFDKIKKPMFKILPDKGLIYSFIATEEDFKYIDPNENLTLEIDKKKNQYEITLVLLDQISETFEVQYIVNFQSTNKNSLKFWGDTGSMFDKMEDKYSDEIDMDDDDEYFEEDIEDKIKKGKIKIKDYIDIDEDDDEDEDF